MTAADDPRRDRAGQLGVEVQEGRAGKVLGGVQVPARGTAGGREIPLDVEHDKARELSAEVGDADEGAHSASQAADGTLGTP
ncbi:hypothetical protein [Pedococcus sp. 5OH_020]|uniref:hypothetical protein n=1 Tax=Pedococcus sp. 5OH_020 TaxID=2989814 RepID=UPI0022E9F221|nr:hypothetical protein [Pedococcus sp. 5OH_020]